MSSPFGSIRREEPWVNLVYSLVSLPESTTFTNNVKKMVKQVFPEKNVSPITFRRTLPTLVWANEELTNGMSMEKFLKDYSMLINTSVKVIYLSTHSQVLEENYMRGTGTKRALEMINFMEENILDSEEAVQTKESLFSSDKDKNGKKQKTSQVPTPAPTVDSLTKENHQLKEQVERLTLENKKLKGMLVTMLNK